MAVHKVYRDSDLLVYLHLKDSECMAYRITDTVKFLIRFFTTCEDQFIEAKYVNGKKHNLAINEVDDQVVFDVADLNLLEDGPVYYSYETTFVDADQKDYLFTETVKGQTEIILKSRVKYVKQH